MIIIKLSFRYVIASPSERNANFLQPDLQAYDNEASEFAFASVRQHSLN